MGTCQCRVLGPGTKDHDRLVGQDNVPWPRSIPAQLALTRAVGSCLRRVVVRPSSFRFPLPHLLHHHRETNSCLCFSFPLPSLFPFPSPSSARSVSPRSSHIKSFVRLYPPVERLFVLRFQESIFRDCVFVVVVPPFSPTPPGSFFSPPAPRKAHRPSTRVSCVLRASNPQRPTPPDARIHTLLRSSRAVRKRFSRSCSAPSLFSRIVRAGLILLRAPVGSSQRCYCCLSACSFAVVSSNQRPRLQFDEKNFTGSAIPRRPQRSFNCLAIRASTLSRPYIHCSSELRPYDSFPVIESLEALYIRQFKRIAIG